MPISSYDVKKYESVLKSEVTKLTVIAVMFSLLIIAVIVYVVIQIKHERTNKMLFFTLLGSIILFAFLAFCLGSQIYSYRKDIAEEAYMQYEGPATVKIERQIIFGRLPTGYNEYIISFEQDGKLNKLSMRKNCGLIGDIDNIYIVYSKHSNYILEIKELI